MNYSSLDISNLQFDFEAITNRTIFFKSEEINRAAQIAAQVTNEAQQWQTYLNALALFAFEEWLEERAPELKIDREECSILQPNLLNSIAAVCNLKVGNFKVCLLSTGISVDSTIDCPRLVVELPEFVSNFYVAIEIQEEYEQAIIQGFLSYAQIEQYCSNIESLWNYRLSLNSFDNECDRLLLYLRCLEPVAMALPEITQRSFADLANKQTEIKAILTNLQVSDRPWWEMLNWEQAVTLLTSQNYLKLEQDLERSPEIFEIQSLLQLVTRSALNTRIWLEDKIDRLAEGLSWVLMPVLAPAGAGLRAATEELENIITELGSAGIEIPLQARGAYREITLGKHNLRLYAVIWPFLSEENVQEWMLMLVVGCTSDVILPPDLKLRVSDSTGILVQRMTNQNNRDAYLYAQIAGNWDEKFLVSIALKDRDSNGTISVTLPPFTFRSHNSI